jgi:hypothetical protein
MADEPMEVEGEVAVAPPSAMAALMTAAKGKGKASNGDGFMNEEQLRTLNEKEGLPW